jgi:tetratricopeptide (TPR) repeat protein
MVVLCHWCRKLFAIPGVPLGVNMNRIRIGSGIVASLIFSIALAIGAPAPTTAPSNSPTTEPANRLARVPAGPATRPAEASPFATTRPFLDPTQRRLRALTSQSVDAMEAKDYLKARDCLTKALKIDPSDSENLYNMACLDALTGRADEALVYLKKSAENGFDDFSHMAVDTDLETLHERNEFKDILDHKALYQHKAAEKAVAALHKNFGEGYIIEIDDQDKLIFATNTDQVTLDALKRMLTSQAKSQWQTLFTHKPEGYIAVVVPSAADYRRLQPSRNVLGFYNPASHMLIASGLGFVTTHEFTHALHFGDLEAIDQEHPIWLVEGLAVLFERTAYKGDILTPEVNDRMAELQHYQRVNRLIPLAKLLAMKQREFTSPRQVSECYAESGGLIAYLYDHNELRAFYDTEKAEYKIDPTGKMALEDTTKMKLPDLEKDFQAWIAKQKPPVMRTAPHGAFVGATFSSENDGLVLSNILPDSPATKAGLQNGDVVSGLDGIDVRDHEAFLPMLASHKPGETVTLTIRRGKEYMTIPVVLGARPDNLPGATTRSFGGRATTRPTTRASGAGATTRPAGDKAP